jgi:drug/metabolite transporter (DMT)-like permease
MADVRPTSQNAGARIELRTAGIRPGVEYLLALAAAVLLGTGFVLQQRTAEQAPKAHFLHLRLLGDLIRQPWWLVGVAAMVAGQLASGWVVGHLKLSIAEPLLAANLIFALILAATLSRQRVTRAELIGAVLLSAGVAALTLTGAPKSAEVSFGSFAYWPAAAGIGLLAYGLVRAGHRRRGDQRAMLTGIAAGLVFGISDALTRRTVQLFTAHSLTAVLTTWPVYCVLAVGFVGFLLMESAFNAGPLRASLPGIAAAAPVSGIALGMVVFGDSVVVSPGMLALRAAGLAALVIGVILVARAPTLSSLRKLPVHRGLAPHPGQASSRLADHVLRMGRRRAVPGPTAPEAESRPAEDWSPGPYRT